MPAADMHLLVCRHGRYKDVEAMLETGISADVRNEFGNTLLMIAAQNGNKRIGTAICVNGKMLSGCTH